LNNYSSALQKGLHEKEKIFLSEEYHLKVIENGVIEALNNYTFIFQKGLYGKEKILPSGQYYLMAIKRVLLEL
jgi:hypothetical protein